MTKSLARLIVCERSGRWAAALRSVWPQWQASLRETRSLPDCREELAQAPASLLALEATAASVLAVANWVRDVRRLHPAASVVVMLDRNLAAAEWMFREAGAVDVVISTRRMTPLVQLWRRQQSLHAEVGSAPLSDIFDQLPWA